MLDTVRSPTGRHDFHIVAIRDIRCGRIWSILSAGVKSASDPAAGYREPVLLRLWSARTVAAAGSRSHRNLLFFDFGFSESPSMAAVGFCLQSRTARVLQIQILVRLSDLARFVWHCTNRLPFEIAAANRYFILRISQHQLAGRPDQGESRPSRPDERFPLYHIL